MVLFSDVLLVRFFIFSILLIFKMGMYVSSMRLYFYDVVRFIVRLNVSAAAV